MGYRIIGKELYLNGEKVQLEFGNEEQIKFLKKHAEMQEKFKGEGLKVDVELIVTAKVETSFPCICGDGWVYVEYEGEEGLEEFDIVGVVSACRNCKQKYEMAEDSEGDIVARLITNK